MQPLAFLFKRVKADRKRRLYQQWVDSAELPPEAMPKEEESGEESGWRIDTGKSGFSFPYLFLMIATFIISCIILIVLTAHVC